MRAVFERFSRCAGRLRDGEGGGLGYLDVSKLGRVTYANEMKCCFPHFKYSFSFRKSYFSFFLFSYPASNNCGDAEKVRWDGGVAVGSIRNFYLRILSDVCPAFCLKPKQSK